MKKIKWPFWLKVLLAGVYIAIGCFAWGFASSDYFFNELSKKTHMVGDIEVNLGVAWFYCHLAIMYGMIIAVFVIFGTMMIRSCVLHKKEIKENGSKQ